MPTAAPNMDFVGIMYIVLHFLYAAFYFTQSALMRWVSCTIAVGVVVGTNLAGVWAW